MPVLSHALARRRVRPPAAVMVGFAQILFNLAVLVPLDVCMIQDHRAFGTETQTQNAAGYAHGMSAGGISAVVSAEK